MKKLFIIFAILCLAAPAMAADWNFYGSARMATFSVDEDPDMTGVDSDTDTLWAQQGNSRLGATVKVNDQIGGGFEYGTGVNVRKLYGTYTFGGGSQLLLGQTYTPTGSYFYSNSVFGSDGDLFGVGQFYAGRQSMIQWSMAGFKVALVNPSTATVNATTDIDTTIPKIEASYKFKSDTFFIDVFGGYNSFTDERTGLVGGDYDYDSYVVGLGGGLNFGAFFANAGVHMGQNLGNYGNIGAPGVGATTAANLGYQQAQFDAAGALQDNDGLGYLAVLGFNASEMFTIEAGYGYEEGEVDNSNVSVDVTQYYLNSTINIAPGFFIVPEVGMITTSADGVGITAEPETFYWGAKWQINF